MDCVLPSELARLVYGYLIQRGCSTAAQTFLETSPLLAECLEAKQRGRVINSNVRGLSLDDIIEDHCATLAEISETQENFPTEIQRDIESVARTLTQKLKIILPLVLQDRDNQKTGSKDVIPVSNCVTEHVEQNSLQESKRVETEASEDHLAEEDMVSESLPPSLFLQPIFENTELHEKIAQNMNKIIGSLPLTPDNADCNSELDAAIHSVVEQTEADPVFQRLINEVFQCSEELSEEDWMSDTEQILKLKDCETTSSTAESPGNVSTHQHSHGFKDNPTPRSLVGNPGGISTQRFTHLPGLPDEPELEDASCLRLETLSKPQSSHKKSEGDGANCKEPTQASIAATSVMCETKAKLLNKESADLNRDCNEHVSPPSEPTANPIGVYLRKVTPRTRRFGKHSLRRQLNFCVPDRRLTKLPQNMLIANRIGAGKADPKVGFITTQNMLLHPQHSSQLENTLKTAGILNFNISSTSTSTPIVVTRLSPRDLSPSIQTIRTEEKKTVRTLSRQRMKAREGRKSKPKKAHKIGRKKSANPKKSKDKTSTKYSRCQVNNDNLQVNNDNLQVNKVTNPIDERKEWDADLRGLVSNDVQLEATQLKKRDKKYAINNTCSKSSLQTKLSPSPKSPNSKVRNEKHSVISGEATSTHVSDSSPLITKVSNKKIKKSKDKKVKQFEAYERKHASLSAKKSSKTKKIAKERKNKRRVVEPESTVTNKNIIPQTKALVNSSVDICMPSQLPPEFTLQRHIFEENASKIVPQQDDKTHRNVAEIAEELCRMLESDHSLSDDSELSLRINTSASGLSPCLDVLRVSPVKTISEQRPRKFVQVDGILSKNKVEYCQHVTSSASTTPTESETSQLDKNEEGLGNQSLQPRAESISSVTSGSNTLLSQNKILPENITNKRLLISPTVHNSEVIVSKIPRTSTHHRKSKPKNIKSNSKPDLCNFVNRRNVDNNDNPSLNLSDRSAKDCDNLSHAVRYSTVHNSSEEGDTSSAVNKFERLKRTHQIKLPVTQSKSKSTYTEISTQNPLNKKFSMNNVTTSKEHEVNQPTTSSCSVNTTLSGFPPLHQYSTSSLIQNCSQDPKKGVEVGVKFSQEYAGEKLQSTSDLPTQKVVLSSSPCHTLPLKKRKATSQW